MSKLITISIILIFCLQSSAQTSDSIAVMTQDTIPASQIEIDSTAALLESDQNPDALSSDSTLVAQEAIADMPSKEDSIVGFFSLFNGEPGKAALYSLIIPGGGQVYNKRWFKAPLAVAADATAIGIAVYWTRQYNRYTDAYILFINEEIPNVGGVTNITTLASNRDRLRQYRDYSWFAVGVVHIVTVVEAFVDRHLLEFDMDEDLTLEVISIRDPYSVTLASINYSF